jgi:hypothetical protein
MRDLLREVFTRGDFEGNTVRERIANAVAQFRSVLLAFRRETPIDLIFGWVDQAIPGILHYQLRLTDAGQDKSNPAPWPDDSVPTDTPFIWAVGGKQSKIMETRLKAIIERKDPIPRRLAGFAQELIQSEIDADKSGSVGPPINVLIIDSAGARWYNQDRESNCPPIQIY